MRILIVEDDARTMNYLRRGLAEAGHVVDVAADGATGFALAGEGTYDVIVLDRRLSEMNGIDFVVGIRRLANPVPVLMLSAQGGLGDRVEGLKAGAMTT